MTFEIREAAASDVPDLIRLVLELATYEKEPESATATGQQFTAALFPADGAPTAYAHVGVVDGAGVVGMALWFVSFSTWTGTRGIWLEDLYVEPEHRGYGLGSALLATLARVCSDRGYARLEWNVLDWNTPSIEFYEALGATRESGWMGYRLSGAPLTAAAQRSKAP